MKVYLVPRLNILKMLASWEFIYNQSWYQDNNSLYLQITLRYTKIFSNLKNLFSS